MKRSFSDSFQVESNAGHLKDLAVQTSSIKSASTGIPTPLSSPFNINNNTLDPYPYAFNDCDHQKRRRRTSSILRVQSLSMSTLHRQELSYNLVDLDATTSLISMHNLDLDLDDHLSTPQDLPFPS